MLPAKNRSLIILTGFLLITVIVLLFFVWRYSDFIKILNSSNHQIQNIAFEKLKFEDFDIWVLPVEITSEAENMISYKVNSHAFNDKLKKSFKIILGPSEGKMRGGTCEYDLVNEKFTGNASWKLYDTESFVTNIKSGDKALLRFYFPKKFKDSKEENYNTEKFAYLDQFINEVNQMNNFSKEYVLVPDEVCIGSQL